MPTKIEKHLSHEELGEFCQRLLEMPGQERTLAGIQGLAAEYGITVSHEGARSFKGGPFARYIEKLEAGKRTRDALVHAAGAGIHPLDAIEEAMVIELQDHLTEAEEIDVKFVIGQVMKLRTSISMREETRRKQTDLERKLRESEKKIQIADSELRIRDERIAKLEREREAWEQKKRELAAQAEALRDSKPGSDDELREKVVDLIDRAVGLKR
ncbi:hypothetical protein [Actomonas aquatica]|uniref:KfrA N-terminal DNA-binding domain-containing protein n=1 Tax=Actomonas aquatica TaxID=2866162 RepID=A0ABZ1CCK3_9BACT|nr:hypothetical protein [Opitutus sp. WL0086]WRQ89397.1 hypothetical protein K1X11_008245 [Opitutus sp. WL0086]